MNLAPTDEQVALAATVTRCLAAASPVAGLRPLLAGEVARWTPDGAWAQLAELGALGLLAPIEAGGSGLGMVEAAMVAEACGAALYPGPWIASAVGAVRALAAAGADELLSAVVAGTTVAAVVLPSPLDGAMACTVEEGTVSGRVGSVLGAPVADVLLVPVGAPDGAVEVRVVDAGAGGVDITPHGLDPSIAVGDVTLDGASSRAVGTIDGDVLRTIATDVIVAAAADAVGAASAVLDLAVEHAKVRRQFDQPIGAFQAVQHLCVDAYETVELARSGVLHASWAADDDAGDPALRRTTALRCAAFADRLATVGDAAIQVLGGIGFTWEHDAHLHLRRLLTWSSAFGPPSSYRIEVARSVLAAVVGAR